MYQLLLRSAIEVLFIYFIVFINSQFLYVFILNVILIWVLVSFIYYNKITKTQD